MHKAMLRCLLVTIITMMVSGGMCSEVVLSCVDSGASLSEQGWISSSPFKRDTSTASRSSSNGSSSSSLAKSESWYYEGVSPTSSSEVSIMYNRIVAGQSNNGRVSASQSPLYLYVEFMNDSPRRVAAQPFKSSVPLSSAGGGTRSSPGQQNTGAGAVVLLPGDFGEWGTWVGEVGDGARELTITVQLKKPQKVYFRKLVLFRRVSASASLTDATVTRVVNSCSSGMSQEEPRNGGGGAGTTITPPASNPSSTTTTRLCRNKATGTENNDGGNTCQECKCVCNCDCGGGNGKRSEC